MAFWITLMRGILAIALGVGLLFWPDKAQPVLANFMGMFWLLSGIVSLRWGIHGERARGLSLLAGIAGVLAGIGMLSSRFTTNVAGRDVLLSAMGLIIFLTGLLHALGGFRTGPVEIHPSSQHRSRGWARAWSWTAFLLGLFEMVLGVMLFISPMGQGPTVYYAASLWALLGGVIFIGDAVRLRQAAAQQSQEQAAESPGDG